MRNWQHYENGEYWERAKPKREHHESHQDRVLSKNEVQGKLATKEDYAWMFSEFKRICKIKTFQAAEKK